MACRWVAGPRIAAWLALALALAASLSWGSGVAEAGGGPENVFLVVNSHSQNSLTVANAYIRLRRIPPGNVFYLNWDGSLDATDIDTFREKILLPALSAIETRSLYWQIDYLVYSSDFPVRIDFAGDLPESARSNSFLSASITGLTYLYQLTNQRNPLYMSLQSNYYMRREADGAGTHGFRGWYGWGPDGELLESGGSRYLLSTMLAVTVPRGNTVPEALSYLRRAAEADGSRPKGTVYYMDSGDKRSKPRSPQFETAVTDLKKLGIAAEAINGVVPLRKNDVAGAMLGYAVVPWEDSRSKILPGAIVENLTSFGAVFSQGTGQTVLTDFLRFGAAGSSGAVVEPYAIPNKFPAPAIHVHYGRGCSLAEAFYQSVWGPYQLLVVGDPLCRPWASIPEVKVEGVPRGGMIKGKLELKPTAKSPSGRPIDRFELFVNGLRVDRGSAGTVFTLDTEQVGDGYSEIRVVAIESGPIETQGEAVIGVNVNNHGRTIDATPSILKLAAGKPLKIHVSAPKMDAIAVYDQSQLLGTVFGESGDFSIETSKLGEGLVTFRAVGRSNETPPARVLSKPIYVEIESKGK